MTRLLALALSCAALSACGLQPVYSGGSAGPVASLLDKVTVDPIEGKSGWLVRNALSDRLKSEGNGQPQYKLQVKLDDNIEGFGLRSNDTITRERRTLRARYQLVDIATDEILIDATAGSDAGIDVVSSEYATVAAENTALENLSQKVAEQIVTRLTLYAHQAK